MWSQCLIGAVARGDQCCCSETHGWPCPRRRKRAAAGGGMHRAHVDGAQVRRARSRSGMSLRVHRSGARSAGRCARTARKSAHFCANRASPRVCGMNRSHAFATRPRRLACCACARAISPASFPQIEQCQAFPRLVLVLSEAEEVAPGRPTRPPESPQSRLCERFQRVRCAHSVDTAKSAD